MKWLSLLCLCLFVLSCTKDNDAIPCPRGGDCDYRAPKPEAVPAPTHGKLLLTNTGKYDINVYKNSKSDYAGEIPSGQMAQMDLEPGTYQFWAHTNMHQFCDEPVTVTIEAGETREKGISFCY